MRHRRVLHLLALGVVALWALAWGSAADASPVGVKPSSGSPMTRFVLTFRAPNSTGRAGAFTRSYAVQVHGGSAACSSQGSARIPRATAEHPVRLTLNPPRTGWCAGEYVGRIDEVRTPACGRAKVCPKLVSVVRRIGTFRFRVAPSRSSQRH